MSNEKEHNMEIGKTMEHSPSDNGVGFIVDQFSPIIYNKNKLLANRWGIESVTNANIKKYQGWVKGNTPIVMKAELFIELYLTHNIRIDIEKPGDIFDDPDKYFNKKNVGDIKKIFNKMKDLINNDNQDDSGGDAVKHTNTLTIEDFSKLMFGDKIYIWSSLKKNIFKSKFFYLSKNKKRMVLTVLNNLRHLRNGIAHYESEKQIVGKMRLIKHDITKSKSLNLSKDFFDKCVRSLNDEIKKGKG